MLDNKTLRTKHESNCFVIIVNTKGCLKYISKEWFDKYGFNYTVKLSKALKFCSIDNAKRFIENNRISLDYTICEVCRKESLVRSIKNDESSEVE